jgi:hypothetical protein
MPEPTSAAATALSAAGITIFGVALGLHPAHLFAGFCGAMWSLSLCPPMPAIRRLSIGAVSTFVAGYGTPAVVAFVHGLDAWPATLTGEVVQFPAAVLIGFGAHQVIGPALLKFAARKADEITK